MGYFNSQSLKIELKPVDLFSLHVILVPDTLTCNYDVMYVTEWLYIFVELECYRIFTILVEFLFVLYIHTYI